MSTSGQHVAVSDQPSSGMLRKWLPIAVGALLGHFAVRTFGTSAVRIFGGMLAGMLVGLFPYFIAKSRDNPRLARKAMISCTIAGAAMGILLAAPVAIGFALWAWPRGSSR